jgi:hypothetical protein
VQASSEPAGAGWGDAVSRIFLSHSSFDNTPAMALQAWLTAQRPELANEIFLDINPATALHVGQKWKGELFKNNSCCETDLWPLCAARPTAIDVRLPPGALERKRHGHHQFSGAGPAPRHLDGITNASELDRRTGRSSPWSSIARLPCAECRASGRAVPPRRGDELRR